MDLQHQIAELMIMDQGYDTIDPVFVEQLVEIGKPHWKPTVELYLSELDANQFETIVIGAQDEWPSDIPEEVTMYLEEIFMGVVGDTGHTDTAI